MRRALVAAAGLVALVLAGRAVVGAAQRLGVHQGFAPSQPIAFSHEGHAGEHQIPCLYCHFGAERSRHAGIPPAAVCMNCHRLLTVQSRDLQNLREALLQERPLQWVKVHDLPDFVAFSHRQHVLGGVACQECHGPVATMAVVRQEAPLSMGWCLDCHRSRGVDEGAGPVAAASAARLDCGKCHY